MSEIEIIKSKIEKRLYKFFVLENGIRCMLIHDPEGDMSAASLNVNVGAALDPREYPGSAHFLEHMLFQGTEKYPSENEYSEFMSNNGGYNNAYTSQTNTNYHFECSNEAFEEGFDRMAQFFISPMFSKDSAEREVNAVDSEYNMCLQVDEWHSFNLHQSLSNKDSLYNKFMIGNLESLNKDGIREVLLDFHKQWYSSNIMCVCLNSKNSLEDMTKWVTEKLSPVKNFNVTVPDLMSPPPFTAETQSKLVRLVPIKDLDQINFCWITPYVEKDIKRKPLGYYSHLFGHEGENSILSWLKNEGLALELTAGDDHNLKGFSQFDVSITLTKKGLENYEQVIEAVFQYAKTIVEKGPQEYVFKECQKIGQMSFEFADKVEAMDTVVGMTERIQILSDEEMPQILRSKYVADVYDPEYIKQIGELLTRTDNLMIFLKSKSFEQDEKVELVEEKWFKTKHQVEQFSPELLKKMHEPNCDVSKCKLDLPPENLLIPENLDVLPPNEELSKKTHILKQWEDADLWYKKDDKFDRPKAYVYMKIYTADDGFGTSADKQVFATMWDQVVQEYLREFSYMADCAKMGFSKAILYDNIDFSFWGFNDKMPNYISEIFKRIISMKDADLKHTFENVKEKVLLSWKNFYLDQTFRQCRPAFRVMLYENSWEKRNLKKILETFTFEQFKEQLATWLKGGQYVFYVHGNYEAGAAIELVEQIRALLNLNLTPLKEIPKVRTLALKAGQSITVWDELDDKTNDNSCAYAHYELGPVGTDYKRDLCLRIICQSFEEPFFDDLRTKQQLGYIVFTRYSNERGINGIWFLVQSDKKSAEYLVNCINRFIMARRKIIADMTEEEFNVQKKSVHTQLAEKDKNLADESGRFWGQIATHSYDFDKQEKSLQILETVTLADFKDLFEHIFFSEYTKRIDFELTSETHKYNQAEYLAKNAVDPYFKDHLPRTIFPGNISEYKKQATYREDLVKDAFMKFRGEYTSSKPTFGYWGIRGLASNIRYQLKYCGVDFDMQTYTAPDQWFGKDKVNLGLEFANLPYFIHGGAKITETLAIHHYIAEVYDTSLLGKDAKDRATVDMLTQVIKDMRMKIVGLCYQQEDKAKACEEYKTRLPPILAHLGSNKFLVGDYPTTIDFYFYETVQILALISDSAVFKEHEVLVNYCKNFKQLKGVKEYLEDPFCPDKDYFFNAPNFAKINGKQAFF